MRVYSHKVTPSYICQYIIKETPESFYITKDTVSDLLNTMISKERVQSLLDSNYKVCVIQLNRQRVYNFDIRGNDYE